MSYEPRPDQIYAALQTLQQQVAQLMTPNPFESASVTNGRVRFIGGLLRVEAGGSVEIVGSLEIDGTTIVTGTFRVEGPWEITGNGTITGATSITGNVTATGTWTQNGEWVFNGDGQINGTAHITGDVTLDSDLSVGSGRILVGSLLLDRLGGWGGRIRALSTLLLEAGVNLLVDASVSRFTGNVRIDGSMTATSKFFAIPHPIKVGKRLLHGSLEGPEHGVFYRGRVTFDETGESAFTLPDYFNALVLADDAPTVMATPVGAPFLVGADDVTDGAVTVYGSPGRSAHVLVIAAREKFETEVD